MSVFGTFVNFNTVLSDEFIARTTFTCISSRPIITITSTRDTTVAAIRAFIIFSLTTCFKSITVETVTTFTCVTANGICALCKTVTAMCFFITFVDIETW